MIYLILYYSKVSFFIIMINIINYILFILELCNQIVQLFIFLHNIMRLMRLLLINELLLNFCILL